MLLKGKRCLITGASKGIGEAIALSFASNGADLILAARSSDLLQKLSARCLELGAASAEVIPGNFADKQDVQRIGDMVLKKFGGVDVLVNNAGCNVRSTVLDGTFSDWQHMFDLNVLAPLRLTTIFSPGMVEREDGLIINIGSVCALEVLKGADAYTATKFALRGWSLACYDALKEHNVKVMLINPGMTNTPLTAGRSGHNYERMIQPADVGEVSLLPFRLSSGACPQEVTVRVTRAITV
eukprot:CAMPEP_0113846212 /NCGR_PEP_ID=MMETSP0372-20130328/1183_1 /TAXON_ID=340204 /ORGANISM="Lankesteria abbotti" /LENGTH=239 /DNA_ID=CAMNT_0000815333 /DNA_START=89 /DNA_END=808 /DNA_ORIENTATION=+ /assembly_acc=CAM_ASM_000359